MGTIIKVLWKETMPSASHGYKGYMVCVKKLSIGS